MQEIINKLINKEDLTGQEAGEIVEGIVRGELSPIQTGMILTALRMKGETVEEIVGLVEAMRGVMVRVVCRGAIDVCGTGGDGSNSINVSTAVSMVVAACGVGVVKHGNRAVSSKSGAADVLEALGVNFQLTPEQAERVYREVGMVFLFAPLFHPATKQIAIVRRELRVWTVFNFLGPFLNPASVERQLIGVPSREIAEKLIMVGKKLGYKHLVIVASEDGMDEVSVADVTHVFDLKNGRVRKYIIDPQVYGFRRYSKSEVEGGSAEQNAGYLMEILRGVTGAKRDIVVLNSAVALYAGDRVASIEEGIGMAERAIDSGGALGVLERLRGSVKRKTKNAK